MFSDTLLGASGETEDDSSPKQEVEKPPSTPDMSACDAEAMVDSMLQDSPLPDTERGDDWLPEDGGDNKLPEEEDGGELPEGGNGKLPEETPAGKLVPPCTEKVPFFALNLIKYRIFPLHS